MILKTGWKKWDLYLSKFLGKKVNILEIGSYRGDATAWFLNNLVSDKKSMVYAVDTWSGSPEYFNSNFTEIEKAFNKTIESTGKSKQLIKMKMLSSKALIELNRDNIMFDIIFIDASHEAIDVLSDAILSWNILNENGILIFDDYLWDKIEGDHFRPKIAIDTFVHVYKTQLKTLYFGWQVIIQKRLIDEFNKPVPTKYYDLMNRLNKYNISNLLCILEETPKNININLNITDKKILYKKELGFNNDLYNLSKNVNKSMTKTGKLNELYDLHAFVRYMSSKSKIFNIISLDDSIKSKSLLTRFINFLDNNLHNSLLENICYTYNNKLLNIKDNSLTFLNISYTPEHKNSIIKLFLKSKFNLKNLNYYDINLKSFKMHNNNSTVIFSDLKNISAIKNVCDKISDKVDFFTGSLFANVYNESVKPQFREQYYNVQLLNLIYFILRLQNKGGIAFLGSFFLMTEVGIQLLWILKHFYKKIRLTTSDTSVINSFGNKIICENFQGCTKKDIDVIYNIAIKINEKMNSSIIEIFMENIIDIPSNELKEYVKFKNNIKKYNIERSNLLKSNQTIVNDLIYFGKRSKLSSKKKENMMNKIFIAQLHYLISWINKYNLFENIFQESNFQIK